MHYFPDELKPLWHLCIRETPVTLGREIQSCSLSLSQDCGTHGMNIDLHSGWSCPRITAIMASVDAHCELHLPSENAYLAHRHMLRLSLFTRTRTIALYCTIAPVLRYRPHRTVA